MSSDGSGTDDLKNRIELQHITDSAFKCDNAEVSTISVLYQCASPSISTNSQKTEIGECEVSQFSELSPTPPGIEGLT